MANGQDYKIGKLCGQVESLEKRFDSFKLSNEKDHDEMFQILDDLRVWKIKTVSKISVISTFVCGLLALIWQIIKINF